MAGEQGPENQGDQGKGGSDDKGGSQQQTQFTPVTYKSQEELDAAFSERATRAANTAKQEALKPFQEAGIGVDEAIEAYNAKKAEEDAKKEPSVKEREAREKAERELQAYKDKEVRDKLSIEVSKEIKIGDTPIPASLLAGTTKEEMTEHGKAIVEFFGQLTGKQGPRPPQYNPLQGVNGEDKVAAGDPLRNFLTTGSFQ